jgi:hypothetical protein
MSADPTSTETFRGAPGSPGDQSGPQNDGVEPALAAGATKPVRSGSALVMPALAGAAVALALGVYGRVHEATFDPIFDLGFPSLQAMKAWLATVALAFAAFQITSALGMWGKLPFWRPAPRWLATAHRWSGTCAFLVSLPVAYHCLWALGFQAEAGVRPLVHSLLGCAFYGAFSTKLLALRSDRLPSWGIPVVGATLVVLLTALWLTSALWFFTTVDFPALP